MAKSTDRAIFLHRISYSETSLVATFFTRNSGLQTFLFQGGKKKSQSLFPLSICEITTYQRSDSAMGKLTAAEPIEFLIDIQTNPLKSVTAFFIVEVIRQIVREAQQDHALFDFFQAQILELDQCEKSGMFVLSFLCKLTEALGIQPLQGKPDDQFLILKDGEFRSHQPIDSHSYGGEGVKLLNKVFRGDEQLNDSHKAKRDALAVMLNYYAYHLPGFNVDRSLEIVIDTLYT
jgi:recombinational DNA repair protein (RecF pathway)